MTYGAENIRPYKDDENKTAQVERMFDTIAGRYDQLNRTLSLGFDKGWRKKGVNFLKPYAPKKILDVATGTGDLAINMCKIINPETIIGVDLSEEMMDIGRKKVSVAKLDKSIHFEQQDSLSLTYPNNTFDAVTAAFGVRNFENIEQGLKEMYRVLKPGGHLMILELSAPEKFPMKQLFKLYSKTVIPFMGWLFSKEKSAYSYLPETIQVVPQGKVMTTLLENVGFTKTKAKTFTLGVCTMYTGTKDK